MESGDPNTAQTLFDNSQWRGSAAYKAENYSEAIDYFLNSDSADGHYNRGNALAKSGDLEAAIEAYDQALELQPDMEDALANRDLIEKLKQQQQNQESSEQQDQSEQSNEQNQDQQEQDDEQQQSGQSNDSSQNQQDTEQQEQNEQQDKEQKEPQQQEQEEQSQQDSEQEQEQQAAQAELSEDEKQAQQEIEQMLRRVPDDPGGLLREKFRYQSRQRALEQRRPKPPNDEERW